MLESYRLTTFTVLLLGVGACGSDDPSPLPEDITAAVGTEGCEGVNIADFRAEPNIIQTGEATTLQWTGQGARACDIEPGGLSFGGGDASVELTPTVTTTYDLTCFATACLDRVGAPRARVTVRVE